MKKNPSEDTVVVATYSARHNAEIAKSFLADHGISSFIIADDVHVSFQLTEGVKLLVMQSKAQEASDALRDADLISDNVEADAYATDEEDVEELLQAGHTGDARAPTANQSKGAVVATVAATLVLVLLFFVPWRTEPTEELTWAPIYRPPISHTSAFEELGSASAYYQTGDIAVDILLLQLSGIVALGWVASVMVGAMAQNRIPDEGANRSNTTEANF